jgi:hypothetical protein
LERRIVGFRVDEAGDWIAELDCGHSAPRRPRAFYVAFHRREARTS